MRRLSMKSKKGKAEASDSESTHQDEIEEQGNGDSNTAGSEGESVEDTKQNSKRKNKRGKKKGNSNADAEDGAPDPKKKKKNVDNEEESQEAEEYEVESILDMKENRGKRQFKIRWKGYGPEGDSWENEEDLSCPGIIKVFLEQHDDEKEDSKSKKRSGKGANKGAKKKQKTEKGTDSNESEDEKREYEVDKVMEVHFKKSGAREFLIHWKGFPHKDDTWEPEKNLNCPDLIEKFMARVDKAKSGGSRELRANPQHTERFTLNMRQAGRRLSRRNQGKQRMKYHGSE